MQYDAVISMDEPVQYCCIQNPLLCLTKIATALLPKVVQYREIAQPLEGGTRGR